MLSPLTRSSRASFPTLGLPGPGLPESVLWVAGCQVVQVVVVLLAAGLLWAAAPTFPPELQTVVRIMDDLGWETSFLFTGATSLAAFLIIAPLVRLRIGSQWRAALGVRRVTVVETLLIVAAVAPLGLLSEELYRWGLQFNARCADWFPVLARLAELDALQVIGQQAASTPYPILLVAIAIAPAMTEELVFRGLLGRGLTARWGNAGGMVLTTLLFAAAHGSPAHALATVPVGLCLHWLYRQTGTLWAPILLHALNNALAITLLKYDGGTGAPTHVALQCAALGYLAVVGTLLHSTTRSVDDVCTSASWGRPAGTAFPMLAASSIVTYTCVFIWSRVTTL